MAGRRRGPIVVALTMMLLGGTSSWAQTRLGALLVSVRDATGAAIAANVTLTETTNRGQEEQATAGSSGLVRFAALAPGRYVVRVAAAGFRTREVRDVHVASGADVDLVVTLRVGGPNEVVDVRGAQPRPGAGAGNTRIFDGESLRALPSSDRDPLTFALQAPGAAPPAPGSRLSTQGNTGLNAGGAREAANNFLIDGLDNNDLFLNRLSVLPSIDALAELTVRQNAFDAEVGRSAGARVDMVLRSGTSDVHGTGYEFFRAAPRNVFGATVGGPLGAGGRAFFFASGEGLRINEEDTRTAHVPTLLERQGDFSLSGITIVDPFTGRPFPGNVIPANRISAASRAAAALYPLPTISGAGANYATTATATRRGGSATVKTDQRIGAATQVSWRYAFSDDRRAFPFVARNRNLPGFGLDDFDRGHSLGASITQPLSATTLNVLRSGFTWSRRENLPGRHGVDGFAALGLTGPSLGPDDAAYPAIAVAGLEPVGDDPNLPVVRRTRAFQLVDVLTSEHGRHVFKAGADVRTYASDGYNHLFSRGKMSFSGAFTGSGFADLLLGFPSFSLVATNDNDQALRTWSGAGFLQDEWRPSARLTLATGVRYEYNAPPSDATGRVSEGVRPDRNNVAPRISLAFDPSGAGLTTLRAGYGVFFDSGTLIEHSSMYFNAPLYQLRVFAPSAQSLIRIEDPFAAASGLTSLPSLNTVDPNFRTAYSHEASVSVEHRWDALTGTVRYVGAVGRNLVRKVNINQPVPGPGTLDSRRPIPGYGDILLIESAARSSSHSLQIALDRPFDRGLELHAAYTLGRSMDNASAFLASDGNDNTPQDSRNPDAGEWGPSDYDVRHRFVATLTWQSSSVSPWWRRNWLVGGVVTAQSGRPFTPRLSFDNSKTGNAGGATFASDRPNVLVGPAAAGQAVYVYDGVSFVVPPAYTFGNAGRNSLRGPAYVNADLLIGRHLRTRTRAAVDVRLEMFNAFNRRNGLLPDSFVDHPTFGQVLSFYPARQWQLGVRVTF